MADLPATTPPPSLSRRQRAVLRCVEGHVGLHGYAPTIREIQRELGISSSSVVAYQLEALEQRGLIRRTPHVSRSIVLLPAAHEALR